MRLRPFGSRRARCFIVTLAAGLLWPGAPALAACNPTGTNQTCTNSGAINGVFTGIFDFATLTVTNTSTGSINGTQTGIQTVGATNANNSGSITGFSSSAITADSANITNNVNAIISTFGFFGLQVTNNATVNNAGTISAAGNFATAISAATADVTNTATGTISAGLRGTGISAIDATVNNAGTISGGSRGIAASGTADVVNSGQILGSSPIFSTGLGAGTVNLVNFGTVSATTTGVSGSSVNIFNSGTISATSPLSSTGISAGSALVINTGTVSGTIGISTTGPSNVFNSGTITGTLGTAIQFQGGVNVLTIAPGFVINGNVLGTGNDAFQLGGPGTGTFDLSKIGPGQQYQGFSGFNKTDSSTWTLIGTGNQTWTVLEGVLAGNATIAGLNVAGGGTVSPGNFGTLTVNGPVLFLPGSFFAVNVNAAGQADKIAATGKATIFGGTVQVLAQAGTYRPFTPYVILTANSGVSGTFNDVTTNMPFLTPSLLYTPTSVILTLGRSGAFFVSAAQTPNQAAVASALDKSPLTSPLVLAVLVQSDAGARQAFDALSGEIYGSVQTLLFDESFLIRQEILSRLRQAAYAGAPGGLGALAFGQQTTSEGEALGYAKQPTMPVKALPAAIARERDWTFWAKGLGGWGRSDSDGNAAAGRSTFGGFITGADARFDDMLRLGIAAGYTFSSLNVDARASAASIESTHVAAYAGSALGPVNLRAGAAYSFHNIDTSRTIAFPGFVDHAAGSFDGATAQVFGEVGYGATFGPVAVEPFAGAAFVHVDTESLREIGGLAALAVGSASADVGYSSLGLRAATMVELANGHWLVPRASIAWQHAFDDVTPTAALAFQSTGAAFSIAGLPIARDAALAEAGVDLRLSPNAKLSIAYLGQLADNAQTHSVKGGFTFNY